MKNLWNEEKGYFKRSISEDVFCDMANALALELHLISEDNAHRIVENMEKYLEHNFCAGKILILFAGGCFRYHLDDTAIGVIQGKNGTIAGTNMTVNWMDFFERCQRAVYHHGMYALSAAAAGSRARLGRPLSSRYGNGASVIPLPAWHLPRRGGLCRFLAEPHPCGLKKSRRKSSYSIRGHRNVLGNQKMKQ